MRANAERQFDLDLEEGPAVTPGHPSRITLKGAAFTADASGALHWPARETLIVADLHLEKGSAAAARGTLLPPYDSRATLLRLAAVIERLAPARVIALGDSFHDAGGPERLDPDDLALLRALQRGRDWTWITGNHDPELPALLGGRVCPEERLDGIVFRHDPRPYPGSREIAGHLHPAARLARRGAAVRRKCFIANGTRLVLPAFGAYTGGLNVLSDAFAPLFGRAPFLVWMLGRQGVFPVSRRQLQRD